MSYEDDLRREVNEALGDHAGEVSSDDALLILNERLGQLVVAWAELDGWSVIGASGVLEPYGYALVPLSQHRPGERATFARGEACGLTPPPEARIERFRHGLHYHTEGGALIVAWPPDAQSEEGS